jgi:hypothetical protein
MAILRGIHAPDKGKEDYEGETRTEKVIELIATRGEHN